MTIMVSTGAAAEAAMALGERQAEQAELGILRPQLAAPALGLCRIGLALLEVVAVADQPVDAVLEQPLLVAQIEIHRSSPPGNALQSPRIALAMMLRWISFEPP